MDYRADADVIPPVGCPTATVTINPPDGSFVLLPTLVVLTTNVAGASIYYTLDGSDPTADSNLYSGPFLFDTLVEVVKAVAIVSGCAAGAISTATYQETGDSSFAFAYLCDTGDKVGTFDEFAANGQANDYQFVLQMTLLNDIEILDITILQTDADGVWDSGQSWSTKEYIEPLGVPFHTYPLVLIDQSGPTQLFSAYQTTLGTVAAGTYEWRMWGQPFTALAGYFLLQITLADGTVIRRLIDTICTDPPPPCEPPEFVSVTVSPESACTGDTVTVTWHLSGTVPSSMTVDGEVVEPALSGSAPVVLPSIPYTIVVTAENDCGNDEDSAEVSDGCVPPVDCPGSVPGSLQLSYPVTLEMFCFASSYPNPGGNVTGQLVSSGGCNWRGYINSEALYFNPFYYFVTLGLIPGSHWYLSISASVGGFSEVLWEGTKAVGLSPIGDYTRTATGCPSSPGSLSVS